MADFFSTGTARGARDKYQVCIKVIEINFEGDNPDRMWSEKVEMGKLN